MKNIKSILALSLGALAITGCNDLDQKPMSDMILASQKEQILEDNPEMMSAAVNSFPTLASSRFAIFKGNPRLDTDFGVPSLFLITDHRGQDMASALNDYQWYTAAMEMSDFGGRYYDNILFWRTWYNMINNCNSICSLIPAETENGLLQYFRAQAVGFRAWAYFNLAQMYQFTYAKNPDAPTVPVLTDENLDEAAANGMARATGTEIYAQILKDCNEALSLLNAAEGQGYTRYTEAPGNLSKQYLNQTVIYGLMARAYLFMQDYVNADKFATQAINAATAEGYSPYSIEEVSRPAFSNINDHSWMWGFYTDPSSNLTGLQCWGGQMTCWLTQQTYPSAGCYRCINKKLYETIPAGDVRKNWWYNGKEMPNTLPSAYQEYLQNWSAGGMSEPAPYMTVKFGAHLDTPGHSDNMNDGDVPFMRIEEMYLIQAEARGHAAPGEGAQLLTNLISTYRNPTYVCQATSFETLVDEVWRQRRIELWGEGFSYYDIMRLQKGIDRRGGGFDPTLVFNIGPSDPVLLYEIILDEAENNPKIGPTSNGAEVPEAVDDEK